VHLKLFHSRGSFYSKVMVLNTDGVLLWSGRVSSVSFDASTRYVLRVFATMSTTFVLVEGCYDFPSSRLTAFSSSCCRCMEIHDVGFLRLDRGPRLG